MKPRIAIPISRLHEVFELRDGKLFHRVSRYRARAGEEAGYARKDGYWIVRVDCQKLLRHRVVFAMVHGYWPDNIDHVAGVAAGDDPSNLREATHSQNMQNGKKRKNNTSGAPGVYWDKERSKWNVNVTFHGKNKHYGRFDDFEFAELVAHEARRKLFGEFAPILR